MEQHRSAKLLPESTVGVTPGLREAQGKATVAVADDDASSAEVGSRSNRGEEEDDDDDDDESVVVVPPPTTTATVELAKLNLRGIAASNKAAATALAAAESSEPSPLRTWTTTPTAERGGSSRCSRAPRTHERMNSDAAAVAVIDREHAEEDVEGGDAADVAAARAPPPPTPPGQRQSTETTTSPAALLDVAARGP